jgi:DNA-binding MarR family transcriptional regulator
MRRVGRIPQSLGIELALAETIEALRRAMRHAAGAHGPGGAGGLAVAQLELLSCLAEHPGIRPGMLARLLRLAPNSVTTLAGDLFNRGLITRTTAGADRRAVTLELSGAGARTVADWQTTNTAILSTALATLPAEQRRLLLAGLPALDHLTHAIDTLAAAPPQTTNGPRHLLRP